MGIYFNSHNFIELISILKLNERRYCGIIYGIIMKTRQRNVH